MNSFSFLPLYYRKEWRLVADRAIATHIRKAGKDRTAALSKTIEETIREDGFQLLAARICEPHASVTAVIEEMIDQTPFLVVDSDRPAELVAIVTAYDLL